MFMYFLFLYIYLFSINITSKIISTIKKFILYNLIQLLGMIMVRFRFFGPNFINYLQWRKQKLLKVNIILFNLRVFIKSFGISI